MARSVLVVIDTLNSYEHADAEQLTHDVERVLPAMRKLTQRAADEDVLTIYVNDNFGAWNSNRDELLEQVMGGEFRHPVEPIVPQPDMLFIVKARHSAFYQTRSSVCCAYIRQLQVVVPPRR